MIGASVSSMASRSRHVAFDARARLSTIPTTGTARKDGIIAESPGKGSKLPEVIVGLLSIERAELSEAWVSASSIWGTEKRDAIKGHVVGAGRSLPCRVGAIA